MMIIDNVYEISDIVYLKTDPDQLARVVVAFKVYNEGEIMYDLVAGTTQSLHYGFEISPEKNIINVLS